MPLLAVVGAHLSDQPLNHQLTGRGATLVETTRTEPCYRMFCLDAEPTRPGLVRSGPESPRAGAIEVELWWLDDAAFGSFVAQVQAPLCIGTLLIEDGRSVMGFLCEPIGTVGARDITATGGWRSFLALDDGP